MEQEIKIRISVRNLVEFILRSGDIDSRRGGFAEKEAMQAGSRIHRKIQGRMGSNYRAEVPLSIEIPGDGYTLIVEGRADGIFTEESTKEGDEVRIPRCNSHAGAGAASSGAGEVLCVHSWKAGSIPANRSTDDLLQSGK